MTAVALFSPCLSSMAFNGPFTTARASLGSGARSSIATMARGVKLSLDSAKGSTSSKALSTHRSNCPKIGTDVKACPVTPRRNSSRRSPARRNSMSTAPIVPPSHKASESRPAPSKTLRTSGCVEIREGGSSRPMIMLATFNIMASEASWATRLAPHLMSRSTSVLESSHDFWNSARSAFGACAHTTHRRAAKQDCNLTSAISLIKGKTI
mmetsp:Transcript_117150/g.373122  ORF Transcript_117150/g.373122 Transcript_117150/m.373122 type:complete len:210 (+) Transcript_117150:6849-7478(+)